MHTVGRVTCTIAYITWFVKTSDAEMYGQLQPTACQAALAPGTRNTATTGR